jgi:hypothetical protein
MRNPTLLANIGAMYAGAAIAAGSAIDDNSSRVDMAGWEGVIFMTTIVDSVDTGVAALTVEQNSADSDTGMAALSGAVATATSEANDDLNGTILAVDVYRPKERYVQGVRSSSVANIAFGEIYAIRYGAKKLPVPDGATIASAVSVTSPAEA